MSDTEAGPQAQACPACGGQVDAASAEPLARVTCPNCGEKIRVEWVLGHFVLVETLGVGGMGSVYKARDTNSGRFVALKILRKGAEAGHTVQLQQEARITAAINNPHVVKVFSFGSDHGQFYLVMELVDSGTLEDFIEQQQRLPEKQVLEIAIQIATGLEAAHAIGLIHRDVKPGNILFADSHTAKIVDFGLAGATEAKDGAIWGTPYYVAPERLKNEREDFRSDIYGLGATLFHALAGQPPIEGETNSASKLRELKNQPIDLRRVAPDVSRVTARIIGRMLAPEPAARFSSYQELIGELRRAAGTQNSFAWRTLKRALVLICSLCITALTVAAALFFTGRIGRGNFEQTSSRTMATPDAALVQRYDVAKSAAQQRAREKILEKEKPAWAAAMDTYQKQSAAYNFVAARDTIALLQLSNASLRESQERALKKAKWLIEWKNQLIDDLNHAHFSGAISDTAAVRYDGIGGASSRQLSLKNRHRRANVVWTKLSPPTLLMISSSFIKNGTADAARRQWLCAVFASETDQADAARQFAQAAAAAKPEYAAELPLLVR